VLYKDKEFLAARSLSTLNVGFLIIINAIMTFYGYAEWAFHQDNRTTKTEVWTLASDGQSCKNTNPNNVTEKEVKG
jgi:hypothetical protein